MIITFKLRRQRRRQAFWQSWSSPEFYISKPSLSPLGDFTHCIYNWQRNPKTIWCKFGLGSATMLHGIIGRLSTDNTAYFWLNMRYASSTLCVCLLSANAHFGNKKNCNSKFPCVTWLVLSKLKTVHFPVYSQIVCHCWWCQHTRCSINGSCKQAFLNDLLPQQKPSSPPFFYA